MKDKVKKAYNKVNDRLVKGTICGAVYGVTCAILGTVIGFTAGALGFFDK